MLIDESNVVHAIEKLTSNRAAARAAATTRYTEEPQCTAEPQHAAELQGVAQPHHAERKVEPARAVTPLRVVAPEPATVGRTRVLGMPEWLAGQLAGGGLAIFLRMSPRTAGARRWWATRTSPWRPSLRRAENSPG